MRILTWLIVLFTVVSCARGVSTIGNHILKDGRHIVVTQAKSTGFSGPDITVLWAYVCDDVTGTCVLLGDYSASAPGLVEVIFQGAIPALIEAGGQMGAAALLRPIHVNQDQESSVNIKNIK